MIKFMDNMQTIGWEYKFNCFCIGYNSMQLSLSVVITTKFQINFKI